MKQYILTTIALFILALVQPVYGQNPVQLDSLEIKLWPEYDDPRLLVIIDGHLKEAGQSIRFPIPPGAFINAVASAADNGDLLNSEWSSSNTADGGSIITLTPEGPLFRVEYYVPIETSGAQRLINFALPPGYVTATQATIEVLLPPSSSNISHDPPLESPPSSPTDVIHLQRSLGPIGGDQGVTQKLEYENPTGALTIPESSNPPAAPSASTEAPPIGKVSSGFSVNPYLIALSALAIVLIGAGAYGLWQTRVPALPYEHETSAAPDPRARKGKRKKAGRMRAGRDRFCRQCGKEFQIEDRYCRFCGAKRH